MIVFQELNYDSVRKYWKYDVIYILMKKVITLRKTHGKMKSFSPPKNRKYWLLQMPEATTGGVLQKNGFFRMSPNSQEAPVPEETSMNFTKFLRTAFSKKQHLKSDSEMQTLQ